MAMPPPPQWEEAAFCASVVGLLLHLAADDARGGLRHLELGVAHAGALFAAKQQHRTNGLAVGDDGGEHLGRVAALLLLAGHGDGLAAGLAVDGHGLPVGDGGFQVVADGLIPQFLLADAAGRHHLVTIDDARDVPQGAEQRLRVILGEGGHFADGGVLLEDDLAIPVGVDFQRVALADPQGPANLLGNDHPALFVSLCQVRNKNFLRMRL